MGSLGQAQMRAISAQRLPGTLWEEFCDNAARVAAIDFARKCASFVAENSMYNNSIFFNKAPRKYIDTFYVEYDKELLRISQESESRQNKRTAVENGSPKGTTNKQSSKKLSVRLKSIFNKENLFRKDLTMPDKQGKDLNGEMNGTCQDSPQLPEKSGNGYDIVKEGMFHELANIEGRGDEGLTWQKCRLILSKAPGGFMLEFYVPPKVELVKIVSLLIKYLRLRWSPTKFYP